MQRDPALIEMCLQSVGEYLYRDSGRYFHRRRHDTIEVKPEEFSHTSFFIRPKRINYDPLVHKGVVQDGRTGEDKAGA
jgi:hypothetical protein